MPSYAWRCVCEQPDNALKGRGVVAYALDDPPSKRDGAAQPQRGRSESPMAPEMPKRLKRALREAAMAAHEEELRRALVPLDAAFQRWRAGDVGSGELAELRARPEAAVHGSGGTVSASIRRRWTQIRGATDPCGAS